MTTQIPTVAIIGRTNVGKSALFNTMVGRALAVVEDTPGVTRDRNYSMVRRFGFPFTLVDTGGLIGEEGTGLEDEVRRQAEIAIAGADLVLAIFDGKHGPHPHDKEVVQILRRSKKPVLWVVNKCEKKDRVLQAAEFYQLGIEELEFISATARLGLKELAAKIASILGIAPSSEIPPVDSEVEVAQAQETDQPIRLAILGKPNAGKSTLVNQLLGEQRTVVSNKRGTTRDAVEVSVNHDGQDYIIVDTAGLRRKTKVDRISPERYANLRALRALAHCDVVALVVDGLEGAPSDQDLKLARLAHERGRGLVIVVNKWDAVEKGHTIAKAYTDAVYQAIPFATYASVVFTSAISGRRCSRLLEEAKKAFDSSRTRITTGELNKIFERATKRRSPPVYRGQPMRIYYSVQTGIQPPTFVLFLNYPQAFTAMYERYLKAAIRESHPFHGTEIKFVVRKREKRDEKRSGSKS